VPSASLSQAEIIALVRASTEAVAAEVRALGVRATVRPAPGEWCANEVVGHLLESDRRAFGGRIRTIVDLDRPILAGWNPPAVEAGRGDDMRDPAELIAEFLEGREADLAFVATLDDRALARAGMHPKVGELRVGDLLHEWVHHDREHVAQIQAITQALAWAGMGNARKFSNPSA
jgi:hypothetical protein